MISNSTHVPYWAQALGRSSLVYAASVLIYSRSFEPERPGLARVRIGWQRAGCLAVVPTLLTFGAFLIFWYH